MRFVTSYVRSLLRRGRHKTRPNQRVYKGYYKCANRLCREELEVTWIGERSVPPAFNCRNAIKGCGGLRMMPLRVELIALSPDALRKQGVVGSMLVAAAVIFLPVKADAQVRGSDGGYYSWIGMGPNGREMRGATMSPPTPRTPLPLESPKPAPSFSVGMKIEELRSQYRVSPLDPKLKDLQERHQRGESGIAMDMKIDELRRSAGTNNAFNPALGEHFMRSHRPLVVRP